MKMLVESVRAVAASRNEEGVRILPFYKALEARLASQMS